MAKKNSKLENEYAKYAKMDDKQFEWLKQETERQMTGLEKRLIGLQVQIQQEKDPEKKAKLEEELNGAKETVESERKRLGKTLERMQGFSKNKEAIQKIIAYKEQLVAKRDELIAQKEANNKEIEAKEKELEDIDNEPETKELLVAIKKMDVEDHDAYYAEDWEKYNELQNKKAAIDERKAKIQGEKENLVKANKDIDKKIEEINTAISKCDLAWKSLFQNKTWEEIHAKTMDGRFTRDKSAEKAQADKGQEDKGETEKPKEDKEQGGKPKDDKGQADKPKEDKEQGGKPKDDKGQADKPKEDKGQGGKPQENKGQADKPKEDKEEGDKAKVEDEKEEEHLPDTTSFWKKIMSVMRHPVKSTVEAIRKLNAKAKEGKSEQAKPEQEKPEQEKPAQEKPAQEKPAQEKPAQEGPKQEAPKQEQSQRDAFMTQLQKMAENTTKTNDRTGSSGYQDPWRSYEPKQQSNDDGQEL